MAVAQDVRNKVVVRKLPPGISQEEVQAAIDIVCQGKYDWFTFVPGKVRYTVVRKLSPKKQVPLTAQGHCDNT